jgi:acetylornithine deacetylase/succinyl-diaminopimelate desuccinylase-like protein
MSGTRISDGLAASLRRAVGAREAFMVEVAQDLIQCDSQTPPSDTRAAAEVALKYLTAIEGVDAELYESAAPVMNLVATLPGGRPGKRLVLNGHLDTFPIGNAAAWTAEPLGGELRDGRVYGRGSADMKGGIAAMIAVVAAFAEAAPDFPGEIVLALAGDEESMGELGTQWLIDNVAKVRGDGVIVADVGSPQIVRLGEKGMIWVDVEATGSAAHGAHVHRGVNAVERLMVALSAVKQLESLAAEPDPEVVATIAAARHLSEKEAGAGETRVLQEVTVNIGQVTGGISANLVPDAACARLDIRIPLGLSVAQVESRLHELVEGLEGIRLQVQRRYEPTWTPADSPIAAAVLQSAKDVLGREVAANMRIGASDARLWRRAGYPTVVAGLTPHNLGGPDEYFEVSELVPLAEIHALAGARFLGLL